jgi:hypothetical protein
MADFLVGVVTDVSSSPRHLTACPPLQQAPGILSSSPCRPLPASPDLAATFRRLRWPLWREYRRWLAPPPSFDKKAVVRMRVLNARLISSDALECTASNSCSRRRRPLPSASKPHETRNTGTRTHQCGLRILDGASYQHLQDNNSRCLGKRLHRGWPLAALSPE